MKNGQKGQKQQKKIKEKEQKKNQNQAQNFLARMAFILGKK